MSNSISGFWLHLDQPQRFRLQRIGVGYLEERRLSGIAGHHAAITTACTQVSHQCSKALHRQIACRSARFFLRRTDSEAWAGATGSRRRRSSVNSSPMFGVRRRNPLADKTRFSGLSLHHRFLPLGGVGGFKSVSFNAFRTRRLGQPPLTPRRSGRSSMRNVTKRTVWMPPSPAPPRS